jgi:hypothetical protein
MIRITFLGVAIATALLSSTASAQNKMVYGAGMISCGEWQQYRSTGNKPGSYQAQAWIDGYLSGSNASGNGADFLAPHPSNIAYYAWIDNYCTQNPLDTLLLAVFKLKRELAARAPPG